MPPAVKFRKICKETLEKLRNVDDPNSEDASVDANSDDEIADPSDDGNPNSGDMPASTPKSSTEFIIDSDIDINSAALLDMISEEDIVSESGEAEPTLNTQAEGGEPTSSRLMTVDEAFAMWD